MSDYGKDRLVDLLTECPYLNLVSNMVYLHTALDNGDSLLQLMSSSSKARSISPSSSLSLDDSKFLSICTFLLIAMVTI